MYYGEWEPHSAQPLNELSPSAIDRAVNHTLARTNAIAAAAVVAIPARAAAITGACKAILSVALADTISANRAWTGRVAGAVAVVTVRRTVAVFIDAVRTVRLRWRGDSAINRAST